MVDENDVLAPEGLDEEKSGESGLSIEHEQMKAAAAAGQARLQEQLRANKAAKAAAKAPKTPAPRPSSFDPKRAPEAGYEVKLTDEEWQIVHGPDPLAIWLMRGMAVRPKCDAVQADAPCRRCGAMVHKVRDGNASCLGCGLTVGA